MKSIPLNLVCPRCFSKNLYLFGRDNLGYQKFRCKDCKRQWAPKRPNPLFSYKRRKYPPCPKCAKGTFLHHDYMLYSNFRCNDKSCNHSFKVPKLVDVPPASSKLVLPQEFTMKRMRHPLHIVLTAITLYFIGNSTLRKIRDTLLLTHKVKVSHVTIAKWCKKFAPFLAGISRTYKDQVNLSDSDEWHFDETYIKIDGKDYYLWLGLDSETRFVLDFNLSPHRDSNAAHSLLYACHKQYGEPQQALVSDRYWAYIQPINRFFKNNKHIQVEDFDDVINNNVIEAFNGQFKAWYKPKRGFNSFESANTFISLFIFFYNFIRPHSSLNNMTPAQVAGANYSEKQRQHLLLIS